MSQYIELIDKYRVEKSLESEFSKYAPPDYIWTDNTGELIRCKDCYNWNPDKKVGSSAPCDEWSDIELGMTRYTQEDDFCSYGEPRDASNNG